MIATFCGHSQVYLDKDEREKLKTLLRSSIIHGVDQFLCGAYGSFDSVCASILRELKIEFPKIQILAVTPYITESYNKRNDILKNSYDAVIYPPLETVPYKLAILKRNEWMVDQADFIFAYVTHDSGGAAKTLAYAKRKSKTIIDCGN